MDQFVTAELCMALAFLKRPAAAQSTAGFPGRHLSRARRNNYMLFGAIADFYDEHKPDGEISRVQRSWCQHPGLQVKDAIPG